ncbi:MAG: hypothetical protein AAF518_14030 [Spirochaetota bacterium]
MGVFYCTKRINFSFWHAGGFYYYHKEEDFTLTEECVGLERASLWQAELMEEITLQERKLIEKSKGKGLKLIVGIARFIQRG